jgi:dTMP kinase
MQGTFIVLEGPDGAGTTYHAEALAKALKARGREVLLTAEPTNGTIGNFIRRSLKEGATLSPLALQLLFTADRAEHVESVIIPALDRGMTVISDRYIPSTLIYGEALDLPKEKLEIMNKKFIQPDDLFLLLPPYDVLRDRIARRDARDAFESDALQRKVYAGYVRYAKSHPDAIVIDTSGEKDAAAEEICGKIL